MPKSLSHPPTAPVDMSAGAIDRRLRDLGQLYKLGMSLRDVQLVGRAADIRGEAKDTGLRGAHGEYPDEHPDTLISALAEERDGMNGIHGMARGGD